MKRTLFQENITVARSPLYQALKFCGQGWIEWLEYLVLPSRAFFIVYGNEGESQIVMRRPVQVLTLRLPCKLRWPRSSGPRCTAPVRD